MKNIVVRYAKKSDFESINEIRKQVNDLHSDNRPDMFKKGFGNEIKEQVNKFLANENSDIIVATIDGNVCGFAFIEYIATGESIYCNPIKFYHIMEFGVDENYRRMGVATNIINFCKEESKAKGFNRIALDMWSFNENAEKFYESVGFKTYRKHMEMFI